MEARLAEGQTAGKTLGIQIQSLRVHAPDEFDGAFAAMARERTDAVLVVLDPLMVFHRHRLVELVARHRLPAIYEGREGVDAGGLMSYGPSLRANFRRAAALVDKILKGAKPADLPVEQPTRFELVVNLKTAKALGLTIPQSILVRADEVIQ
jgi:putative tryptophan/tyrosine transport system substrate-binding protein